MIAKVCFRVIDVIGEVFWAVPPSCSYSSVGSMEVRLDLISAHLLMLSVETVDGFFLNLGPGYRGRPECIENEFLTSA
jgi:hypothetical protein